MAKLDRQTLKVEEVAQLLGISRTAAYEAVYAGTIKSLKIGRRLFVPRAWVENFLDLAPGSIQENGPAA